MTEEHPAETELVQFAFAGTSTGLDEMPRHVAECAECRGLVDMLQSQASAVRLAAIGAVEATPECLDDESIVAFVEGRADSSAFTHLLACARCREEAASFARLLDTSSIQTEISRLSRRPKRAQRRSLIGILIAGTLAAALVFMLLPGSSRLAKRTFREESVTGAAAPRLVSFSGAAMPFDAFRWTSVPRADRYRITVFARDGSVIWEALTRDTAIAFPEVVVRATDDTILWRVEAHVGWEDRWAASDLAMLTLRRAPR